MSHGKLRWTMLLLIGSCVVPSTGCVFTNLGLNIGLLSIPIPVSPYFQKKPEDAFFEHERYGKVPILPQLTPGAPTQALDEPSDDQVMRALEKARPTEGGFPFLQEVQRNNVRIVKQKIGDYIDPPRVMPLIGPVQLHHVNWKCVIYYSETTIVGWPIPHTLEEEDKQEVIYIDLDFLHMVGNTDPGPISNY
jgi:hypothetical protein